MVDLFSTHALVRTALPKPSLCHRLYARVYTERTDRCVPSETETDAL